MAFHAASPHFYWPDADLGFARKRPKLQSKRRSGSAAQTRSVRLHRLGGRTAFAKMQPLCKLALQNATVVGDSPCFRYRAVR
jgi:hypothetical protein